MKRRAPASSSLMFLMELITAILIFALASAVCASLFMRSHTLSLQAQQLDAAVEETEKAAELIRGCRQEEEIQAQIADCFGTFRVERQGDITTYTISYDREFQVLDGSQAAYEMTIALHTDGTLVKAAITYGRTDSAEPVYALDIERHVEAEADDEAE